MITPIPLSKLALSTLNVRQTVDDGGTADLEASILSHGLLSALVVRTIVASPKAKQKYGVLAGGRRLRAFQALAARDEIDAHHLIDCVIRDENAETSLELSVIENIARVNLTPVEEFSAFARLQAEDPAMDAAAIAKRFGTTELHVRQRMRLGALQPTILEALGTGRITLDAAKAYAATADQALQLRVFDFQEKSGYSAHNAYTIRQLIKRGESAYDLAMMLTYVGADAYQAAGGHLEEDLFVPGAPRIQHAGTLSELYYSKLEAEKAALAATLPAGAEIATDVGEVSWRRRIDLAPKLDEAAEARWRAIDDEAERISARLEGIASPADPDYIGDDLNEADLVADAKADQPLVEQLLAQLMSLQNESEAILEAAPIALPDGPVVAQVKATADGLKVVGYYRPEGYVEGAIADATGAPPPPAAPSVRETHGLSDLAVEVLAHHRRAILRAHLVQGDHSDRRAPGLYLAFAILRMTVPKHGAPNYVYCGEVGLADGMRAARDSAAAIEVGSSKAATVFEAAIDAVRVSDWMTDLNMMTAFATFCDLSVEELERLQAVAAAQLLGTSLAVPGRAVPLHDQLAWAIGVEGGEDIRTVWEPDAAFCGKLSKPHRLAAVAEVSPRIADKLKGLKDTPLTDACVRFFAAGADAIREYDMLPGQIAHARRWVPAALALDDAPRGPRLQETLLDEEAATKSRRALDAELTASMQSHAIKAENARRRAAA